MSKLLFDSYPLVVIPELAVAVGVYQALILQQTHYWVEHNKKRNINYHDGFYWVYNTYEEWHKQYPFFSESTLKRAIKALEDKELLISGNYNKLKMDRTKWYRVNYEKLDRLACNTGVDTCNHTSVDTGYHTGSKLNDSIVSERSVALGQNDTMDSVKMTPPIPEITTENSKQRLSLQYSTPAHNKLSDERLPEKKFKFSIVEGQIRKCYTSIPRISLPVDEVVYIFKYFTDTHNIFCSYDHPHIKKETLLGLLDGIGHCYDNSTGLTIDLTVECYRNMIDYYFTSEFENCNYSIVHFMSGDIRLNCWYKTCY